LQGPQPRDPVAGAQIPGPDPALVTKLHKRCAGLQISSQRVAVPRTGHKAPIRAITGPVTAAIALADSARAALGFPQGRHPAGPLHQGCTPMGDKKQKPAKPGEKTVKK